MTSDGDIKLTYVPNATNPAPRRRPTMLSDCCGVEYSTHSGLSDEDVQVWYICEECKEECTLKEEE